MSTTEYYEQLLREPDSKSKPSLHDLFAGMAMQGLIQKHGMGQGEAWLAEQAYNMARTMMRERAKRIEATND